MYVCNFFADTLFTLQLVLPWQLVNTNKTTYLLTCVFYHHIHSSLIKKGDTNKREKKTILSYPLITELRVSVLFCVIKQEFLDELAFVIE